MPVVSFSRQSKELTKLIDDEVAKAAFDCDLREYHMGDGGPCRHSYRKCTCGRAELLNSIENLNKVISPPTDISASDHKAEE